MAQQLGLRAFTAEGRGFPGCEAEILQATWCSLKTPKDKPQTPQNKSNPNPYGPPSAESK